MAVYDEQIESRTRKAINVVSGFTPVVCVYVFGSQTDGTANEWSDLDVAVFAEGLESKDLHDRARIAAQVQREAGDDVEIHFFPASSYKNPPRASFAEYVLQHGVRLNINEIEPK